MITIPIHCEISCEVAVAIAQKFTTNHLVYLPRSLTVSTGASSARIFNFKVIVLPHVNTYIESHTTHLLRHKIAVTIASCERTLYCSFALHTQLLSLKNSPSTTQR